MQDGNDGKGNFEYNYRDYIHVHNSQRKGEGIDVISLCIVFIGVASLSSCMGIGALILWIHVNQRYVTIFYGTFAINDNLVQK